MTEDTESIELELLLQAIQLRYHYDFTGYNRSSLRRRLSQALVSLKCENFTRLQERLLHEPDFFPRLLSYLTVNTTELFRDPEYFRSLKENVLPYLKTFPSCKIWVAGCSTGEEILTLAILLREENLRRYVIYATDINPLNLERASKGILSVDGIARASERYKEAGGLGSLSDYYEEAYESVKFDPELLKNVVFSDHSLATDSVFSEMHFISCRNVLIYFERSLQDRALGLFRDSLVRGTFLGLGSKESIAYSAVKDDFTVVDQANRIYQRR